MTPIAVEATSDRPSTLNCAVDRLPSPEAWLAAAAHHGELFAPLDPGVRIALLARSSPTQMLVWEAGNAGINAQFEAFAGYTGAARTSFWRPTMSRCVKFAQPPRDVCSRSFVPASARDTSSVTCSSGAACSRSAAWTNCSTRSASRSWARADDLPEPGRRPRASLRRVRLPLVRPHEPALAMNAARRSPPRCGLNSCGSSTRSLHAVRR